MNIVGMERIGRYQILGELGRGAMGVVYRALDPAIGRTVAIKTIRLSEFHNPQERAKLQERLFREAQSAGMLSHPGIVTIYDIGEEGELAYIAMECVEGLTLDRLVAADPPDGRLILSILSQTAAALDYAHKRGIVHRDIKPANIIVHARKEAKITDFGVAKIQSHQMTHAGSMIGTPNYMSPEQIQGRPVDGRSDQYSLAVIAYELLTGAKPFTGESIATLAFKIVNENAPPIQRLNPTLGWTVDTVIRKALAKNPDDRYPTCSDFTFALDNACRACKDWRPIAATGADSMATLVDEKPVPAAVTEPQIERPRRRPEEELAPAPLRFARRLALVVVFAGILAALLVGGLRWFDNQPAPVARVEPEPPPVASDKPSAMGDPVPGVLPGEEATPPASPPAAEPPQQEPAPQSAPSGEPQAQQQPGLVETRLVTNPPGAFLVVDGSSASSCTSPCTLTLPPGRHTLSATKGGYRRSLKIFELPRDAENFLNLEQANGTLAIKSEPQGATIVVDGNARPERTPAMLTLPAGPHTVEVIHTGQREQRDITIRESAITNLAVTFPER
jgi:serine/threonine-protein kinase